LSSYRFPLIPGRPFSESLKAIPREFASYLRQGFSLLSKVPADRYQTLLERVVESIDYPQLRSQEPFVTALGLKEEDMNPLVAAVSMLCVSLASTDETAESITKAAQNAQIVSESDTRATLAFSTLIVNDRARMKELLQRSHTASRVLPTLDTFDIAIDTRLSFKNEDIVFAVPVLVAHVDTDSGTDEVWFQMSKVQVRLLIEKLQEALRRLEIAEAWGDTRASKTR
jgi:hypothetical protein